MKILVLLIVVCLAHARRVSTVTHLETKGQIRQKRIAELVLADPEVQRLTMLGQVNTPAFKEAVVQSTLKAIGTDPIVKADFCNKLFSSDRFGRKLTSEEQSRLITFMASRKDLILDERGQVSFNRKAQIMEASKDQLKDIYAKWIAFKNRP